MSMEGKVFLCGNNTPPPISRFKLDNFVFDLQRFATAGLVVDGTTYFTDAEAAGYDSANDGKYFSVSDKSGENTRYFNNIQAALNYVYTADTKQETVTTSSSVTTTDNPYYDSTSETYIATIKVLQDVTNGQPIVFGGVLKRKSDTDSNLDVTNKLLSNITLDLGGNTYNFAESFARNLSGNTKSRAILTRSDEKSAASTFTVENGKITTSARTTSGNYFQAIAKIYNNFTFDDVEIDATNLKNQIGGENGAAICSALGTLTLSGSTSIAIQPNNGINVYYAVSGMNATSYSSHNGKEAIKDKKGAVAIEIDLNEKGYIPNVGLLGWIEGDDGGIKSGVNKYYESYPTDFSKDKAVINFKKGKVGEITIDGVAVDGSGVVSYGDYITAMTTSLKYEDSNRSKSDSTRVSLFASTENVSLDNDASIASFVRVKSDDGKDTTKYLLYQKAKSNSEYYPYTFGIEGWNKQTVSDDSEYNYVAPVAEDKTISKSSSTPQGKGEIVLNVKNVDTTNNLAFDEGGKTFGIPVASTAELRKADNGYRLAKLRYNSDENAVTVSTDNKGAAIFSGAYSLTADGGEPKEYKGILSNKVATINASDVSVAVSILGNSLNNAIYDGEGSNYISLGGGENNTLFFGGGSDSIFGFNNTSLIKLGSDIDPIIEFSKAASITAEGDNLILGFGEGESININEGASLGGGTNYSAGVSVEAANRKTYIYTSHSIVEGDGLTLTSALAPSISAYNGGTEGTYLTVDGSAVGHALALTGQGDANYLIGSSAGSSVDGKGNTLYGAAGNDTLVGGGTGNIFRYTDGKDVILNYHSESDLVSLGSAVNFTGAKASSGKLTFSTDNNRNSLTFQELDADAKISLNGGGYLTKDGRVTVTEGVNTAASLKLFSGAKSTIDVTSDLYKGASITAIDASDVKNQAVVLVGGTDGGTFTFAKNNKKKDIFEYNGGTTVTIKNYEKNTDKINLGDHSIASFTVADGDTDTSKNVTLKTGDNEQIVLEGVAKDMEVLIRQDGESSFKKKVFAASNVLADKAKSATSVTVLAAAAAESVAYTADKTVKKINFNEEVESASVVSGGANTTFNASLAGKGITLVSGKGNDKFTGSGNADTFVYTAGKDVIQNYASGDKISLSGDQAGIGKITKISKSSSQVKLTFGKSSNVLTVKGKDLKTLNIDDADYTFGKNAIITDDVASLTSGASGNVKIASFGSGVNKVDASKVTKNLTLTGTTAAESLIAGGSKTTLKGGGGNDTLKGSQNGKDTFMYEKGKDGDVTIQNFGFGQDTLKIANGTIKEITKDGSDNNITFSIYNGKKNSDATGSFTLNSTDNNGFNASNVAIKANNTYYWFAKNNDDKDDDGNQLSGLVTAKSKVSASQLTSLGLTITNIIDLNYSTNLVKSGVAKQSNRSTSTTS